MEGPPLIFCGGCPLVHCLDVVSVKAVNIPGVGCHDTFAVGQVERARSACCRCCVWAFPFRLQLADKLCVGFSSEYEVSVFNVFPYYLGVSPLFGLGLIFCNVFDCFQSCCFYCFFCLFFILQHQLTRCAEAFMLDFFWHHGLFSIKQFEWCESCCSWDRCIVWPNHSG